MNTKNNFFFKVVFLSLTAILICGNFALATAVWNPFPDKIDRQNAIQPELVKMEINSAVYYKAVNGYRYVFPNEKTYKSWFSDFSSVKTISQSEMEGLIIGGNVTYKPNSRLIKITTDPKVYWVAKNGVLRHLSSETLAKQMFGDNWAALVDDLPDAFFAPPTYTIGEALTENNRPFIETNWTIDDNLDLFLSESTGNETESVTETQQPIIVDAGEQPNSINLTGWVKNQDVNLSWVATGGNTKYGFVIIKSINENPIYPTDSYVKINYADTTTYTWENFDNNTYWHFRVCRLNSDNSCITYSDDVSLKIGVSEKVESIVLSGTVAGTTAKLSWEINWISSYDGFYLVRGYSENPKYLTHRSLWFDKTKENYNWEGLSTGIYHFRLCRYTGSTSDLCEYYSNDLQLTIN